VKSILLEHLRSGLVDLFTHEFHSRSQRKAAPSPLQNSTSATSPQSSATPTRTTFSSSGVHNPTFANSPHSPLEQPRSPKERLDDLLASEKSFYKSEDSSVESIQLPLENTR
jgi:RalA-binding protein 1